MKKVFHIIFFVVFFFLFSENNLLASNISITDQLVKLSDLYTKGLITEEEFQKAKSIILEIKKKQNKILASIPEEKEEIKLLNKKKKDKPKLSSLGEVKIRQWGKTKASIAENKNFEKMEMVIGDYRIYTHRPGGIKIKRISDKKQLAVIGDNLKVKYYNNGDNIFEVDVNKEDLELIFKLNGIGILVWQGKYIEEHEAHFYQVLSMGSKPFHYYAKLDMANNAVALNMSRFDKNVKKAIEKVKIELAAEHGLSISEIDQILLNREAKAASQMAQKLNLTTEAAISDALNAGIDDELKSALENTLGRQISEGLVEGLEEAFGQALDAELDEELKHELAGAIDSALSEAIEEAISQGISQAAIEAGLMAFFSALEAGASWEEAIAAGDAACNC